MTQVRRGITKVEIVAVLLVAVIVIVVVLPIFSRSGPGIMSKRMKDAAMIREINQSLIVSAREFNGIMPRPGLLRRLPDPVLGIVPGRGEEDVRANTTANLYSMLIMHNFIAPDLVVSPLERNPRVVQYRSYAYDVFDATTGTVWDTGFRADLDDEAHCSYAHLVLMGERNETHWRETLGAGPTGAFALMGSRGPKAGLANADSYTTDDRGDWSGNILFSDGSVHWLESFTPALQMRRQGEDGPAPDNIFKMEDGPNGADAILSFTKSIAADGPVLQHD